MSATADDPTAEGPAPSVERQIARPLTTRVRPTLNIFFMAHGMLFTAHRLLAAAPDWARPGSPTTSTDETPWR